MMMTERKAKRIGERDGQQPIDPIYNCPFNESAPELVAAWESGFLSARVSEFFAANPGCYDIPVGFVYARDGHWFWENLE